MTDRESTSTPGQRVCPKCGYALQPFEEECPRCAGPPQENAAAPAPPTPDLPPPPQPPPPLQPVPTHFHNAGFWIRVLAAIIDGMVLAVPTAIIFVATLGGIAALGSLDAIDEWTAEPILRVSQLGASGIGLLYYVIMNGTWGATLGKMAVRIKIVRVDGRPIGYGIALARYLIKSILGSCTCSLMFLSVAFNPEYRGWHDQIVGTRVIYTE